ncbi:MAG TPA: hypothetical protein VLH10_07640, partial [Yinghuangia sp.]|nr:hypothetical protein [Yinghuangia sp.]
MTNEPSVKSGIETVPSSAALLALYAKRRWLRIGVGIAGILIGWGVAELRVAIDPGGAANDLLIVLVLATLVPGAFVIGMALHSDARVVRLWLRHF